MVRPSDDSLEAHRFARDGIEGLEWVSRLRVLARAAKFGSGDARAALEELVSPGHAQIAGPVVILAGGTDESVMEEMDGYRARLLDAFQSFRGTVVSGGTRQGVGSLAGDIRAAYPDSVHTVGYLPSLIPPDVSVDSVPDRYAEIRHTKGEGFSPMEPLQGWTDLIASGVDPASVVLVGINGGRIAAAEYRIALALGARVGLIESSGREAAKTFSDPAWEGHERLVRLEPDAETIREFIVG
jgi:hypothetical protein